MLNFYFQATREKVLNGSGLSSTTMAAGSSRSLLSASGMAGKLSAPAKVSAPVRPSRPATEQISEQLNKTPTSSQTTVKPCKAWTFVLLLRQYT